VPELARQPYLMLPPHSSRDNKVRRTELPRLAFPGAYVRQRASGEPMPAHARRNLPIRRTSISRTASTREEQALWQ